MLVFDFSENKRALRKFVLKWDSLGQELGLFRTRVRLCEETTQSLFSHKFYKCECTYLWLIWLSNVLFTDYLYSQDMNFSVIFIYRPSQTCAYISLSVYNCHLYCVHSTVPEGWRHIASLIFLQYLETTRWTIVQQDELNSEGKMELLPDIIIIGSCYQN